MLTYILFFLTNFIAHLTDTAALHEVALRAIDTIANIYHFSNSSGAGLYALLMSTLLTFGLLTVLTILIYRRAD